MRLAVVVGLASHCSHPTSLLGFGLIDHLESLNDRSLVELQEYLEPRT